MAQEKEVQVEVDVRLALYMYDDKLKKVVPIGEVPVKLDDTRNHVNMRTTWSGTTKIEFRESTIDSSSKIMNGE
mgnify:CR=1 FL=1